MKHADQETLHAKDMPPKDSATTPIQADTPARQMRQGTFLSRVWAFFWHALHSLFRKLHRKRVPELRQMSMVECGLACLAMILSHYGRKTSISELRMRYKVSRDGLSALGIVRVARNYGMRVRAISLQLNDFRFVKLPAIVHWEFNHFLVVERWSRKWVDVVDPARGRRRLTYDEFDAGFTGVVITLEPGVTFDPRSSPSPRAFRTYVLQYMRQAPVAILQLLGASLLLQILGLTFPLVTKVVIDQVLPFGMRNVMAILGIGILVLFLSQTVTAFLRGWLLVYLQTRIDMHMMLGFIEHLLKLPYSFFEQRSTGDLLTRMASNEVLRDILSSQLLFTVLDSGLVIFYLLILLWQSPPIALLALAIGLLQILILLGSNRPIRNLASRQLAAQGKSQGYLTEALAGMATLKGSGAEQRAFERWSNLFFDQLNISMRYSYLSATVSTIMAALRVLAPLALLWVGATQVLNGSMTLGTMVALTALGGAFLSPLGTLVSSGQQFQLIGAHLERIADVTEAEPEQQGQEAQLPPPLTGHIRLENVSFRYAQDAQEVLHHIDLAVEAGQKVAIVGPSGSGKSTLGKLLLGLYVPTEGAILYDGIPLQQLNYQEVRRQFGVVLQEATLFSGSILSNIALNNPTIDKERIFEVAEIAAIHEDIMGMPMGYETFVAEGGSALSGGQRQRLSVARAIAHKPALLLLDEATSHLDVATEQKVAEHLQTLACTQIIIAHRLSTIRNADVILVLDQGKIVERGSHDELLQRNGYYARLMHQQMEHGVVTPGEEKTDGNANLLVEETAEPQIITRGLRMSRAESWNKGKG
jgi:ATP-binding cassette subfamily B protein